MDEIKRILGRLLKNVPNYEAKTRQMEICEAWPRIVGERSAQHSWPVCMLEDGVLLVAAESSAWLHSLRFLEPQILAKYEQEFKARRVKQLRFKLQTKGQRE